MGRATRDWMKSDLIVSLGSETTGARKAHKSSNRSMIKLYEHTVITSKISQNNYVASNAGYLILTTQALEPTGLQLNLGTREGPMRDRRNGREWVQGAYFPSFLASGLLSCCAPWHNATVKRGPPLKVGSTSPITYSSQVPGNCPCPGPFACSAGSSNMKFTDTYTQILLPRERKKGEEKSKKLR